MLRRSNRITFMAGICAVMIVLGAGGNAAARPGDTPSKPKEPVPEKVCTQQVTTDSQGRVIITTTCTWTVQG